MDQEYTRACVCATTYLRTPEPVPATLIRVDDVLAVSLNCSDTAAQESLFLSFSRPDNARAAALSFSHNFHRRDAQVGRDLHPWPALSSTLTSSPVPTRRTREITWN